MTSSTRHLIVLYFEFLFRNRRSTRCSIKFPSIPFMGCPWQSAVSARVQPCLSNGNWGTVVDNIRWTPKEFSDLQLVMPHLASVNFKWLGSFFSNVHCKKCIIFDVSSFCRRTFRVMEKVNPAQTMWFLGKAFGSHLRENCRYKKEDVGNGKEKVGLLWESKSLGLSGTSFTFKFDGLLLRSY